MPQTKSIKLPEWLDKIIYDDFQAIFEPQPQKVVYNPDQPYEFVQIYLGTYFPRSYAEAFCIMSNLFSNTLYFDHISKLEEVNILDFCCGTGGELVGVINALQLNFPNIQRINIDAFDANPDAIRFLYHLIESLNSSNDVHVKVNINPQGLYIESEQEINDIVNLLNIQYQFIMSFKALNEFIQHKTFNKNVYEIVLSHLLPLLASEGIFILSDVTTKLDDSQLYYPILMNQGVNKLLKNNISYKSVLPYSCYTYENKCSGCYMQDTFYVSHRYKSFDISKVAYRVICNTDFANYIIKGFPSKSCRATNPYGDKSLPYN